MVGQRKSGFLRAWRKVRERPSGVAVAGAGVTTREHARRQIDRFDENYSDPKLVEETIKRIDGLEYLPDPIRASEDFGFYKQFAPCMFFFVGMGDCPSLHNDLYKFDDDIIETGVELFKKICRLAK